MSAFWRWIDEQTGLITAAKRFVEHPLPTGTGWLHTLGALAVFLFLLQAITGVFLALYYVPTPDHAYASVQFITYRAALGKFVRGLHLYATDALALVIGLHMLRAFLWGAYKKPRQIVWVVGTALLVLAMAFTLTGVLLPWDQNGYWATVIRFNLAGSVPIVGPIVQKAILGGKTVGALTLTRFYAMHVFFLPGIMAAFILFHVCHVRAKGITPPWRRVGDESGVERSVPFFPNHVLRIAVVSFGTLMVLFLLTLLKGAPLDAPVDPNSSYAQTHWYFMYLFELVHLFPGKWQFVGGAIIPVGALVAYIVLPYVDRNPERRLGKRPFCVLLVATTSLAVTLLGTEGERSLPVRPKLSSLAVTGQKLFLDLRCEACHGINGGGGTGGPDMATGSKRDPRDVETWIRTPTKLNPRSIMPAYDLRDEEMKALVAYVMSITPSSTMPAVPASGPPKPASHRQDNYMIDHKFEVRRDPQACVECHQPRFCQSCHQKRLPDSHLQNWMPAHSGASRANESFCQVCHAKKYCDSCHRELLHGPGWLTVHVQSATSKAITCGQCHTQRFCVECHQGAKPKSHKETNFIAMHASLSKTTNCAQCHEQKFCTSCHTGAKPASHRRPNFMTLHVSLSRSSDCSSCHAKKFCADCHNKPRPKSHTVDFRDKHGKLAKAQPQTCLKCHQKTTCDSCHRLPMPHPPKYAANHTVDASRMESACANCHLKKDCLKCHEKDEIHLPNVRRELVPSSDDPLIGLAQLLRDSPSVCPAGGSRREFGR